MDPSACFSKTYAEARERFVAAARARGLPLESHVLPDLRGIEGEALAMDVALTGSASAAGLLVLWSATHGVDHVRLAASIGADDADQLAGCADRGGIDERLEPGELDLGEAQLETA